MDVLDDVTCFRVESSSDRLKGEESLFAYLLGFGMLNWVESEKRMKLRKCGYKSGSFG